MEEVSDKVFELFQNKPNPFDEATIIDFQVFKPVSYSEAYILITDMQGREIKRLPTELKVGLNEVLYTHGYNATGVFAYSLVVDGKVVAAKRMVFAN